MRFKKGLTIYMVLALLLSNQSLVFSQEINAKSLQKEVKTALNKSFSASVFLIDYSPGPLEYFGHRSSGVVVKDGFILTAGHATVIGKKYKVVFPDGKETSATGWSKIPSFDVGVLKMDEEGLWPYAEMGWSSSLKPFDPCISVAYPGSFQPKQMVLRFGYVVEPYSSEMPNMTHTTCIMEPGDSGGPVYDLHGRVIGIRSTIFLALEDNFDVPIDTYRKYWSSLIAGGEINELPKAETLPIDPFAPIKGIKGFDEILFSAHSNLDDYTIQLYSQIRDSSKTILGSLVSSKGLNKKFGTKKGLIISKSSMVGDEPFVLLKTGEKLSAKVLMRDDEQDLILLQVTHSFNKTIDIGSISEGTSTQDNLGDFIISPNPSGASKFSVIGSTLFDLKRTLTSKVIFGASLEKVGDKVYFKNVSGPAVLGGLQTGDELIGIDEKRVLDPADFANHLSVKKADDEVKIKVIREGIESIHHIILLGRPAERKIRLSERFTDGKSERRNGFKNVFVHDGKLKPTECGGPIFDLKGRFIGINIARYSRTSSLAITALEIKKFIEIASMNF